MGETIASKYDDLARTIVDNVGGVQNIRSLTHCVTRLRFSLGDESLANKKALEGTDGVLKVIQAGGQYQVVIGNKVTDVYDAILANYDIKGEGEVEADPADTAADQAKGGNVISNLMGVMSSILMPVLPALTADGIIKGVVALLAALGWLSTTSGVYMLLYAAGDGFFYFLPIMLGFTAAKRFKCNPFVGATIGALQGKIYVFGGSGLFGLANYVDPSGDPTNFVCCLIGIVVAMVAEFIFQWVAYDFDAEKQVLGE